MVITRHDYMTQKNTHREFYGQFVNESVKTYVANCIGRDRILKSADPHFNDIMLRSWDNLTQVASIIDRDLLRQATGHNNPKTYPWSLCLQVCIAKEAARQIKEENQC